MKSIKNYIILSTLLFVFSCSEKSSLQTDISSESSVIASSDLDNTPIITQNNSVKLLTDGEQIFPEVFKVIDSAQKKIFVTTYLFGESIGRKISEKLVEKKKQGLEVQFIAEKSMGTIPELVSSAKKEYDFMIKNGVDVRYFPVDKLPKGPTFLSNRKVISHAKLIIADDETAIMGGMNLKDSESINHDYMVLLKGDSVKELAKIADENYSKAPNLVVKSNKKDLAGNDTVELAQTGFGSQSIDNLMLQKINQAQKSIDIEMLLIDYKPIVDALTEAKKRGVEVRVIVDEADIGKYNKILDKLPIEGLANFGSVMLLDEVGIPVKWYVPQKKDQVLHAKVMIIDNKTMVMGSANMTYHALTRNHEIAIAHNDQEAISKFLTTFNDDWATKSKKVELTSTQKLIGKLFRKIQGWIYQNKTESQIIEEVHRTIKENKN